MPSLSDLDTGSIKMLLCGKPGTGKTGSLISILVDDPEARLFVANFDRGNIRTLANVARIDPKTGQVRPNAESLMRRVSFHNFEDTITNVNGVPLVTGVPQAFSGLGKKLNDWGEGHGGLASWGKKDWLVIDSITALSEAAMRYALNQNRRLNQKPQFEDFGDAIQRLSLICEMINDPSVVANVCCITHVRYLGDLESGKDAKTGKANELEALPSALGQKLPQEIGRYFNNIIQADTVGSGPGQTRRLFTKPPGKLVLRTSNPGKVKPDYPLDTGMADLVRDLRFTGMQPPAAPVPSGPTPGAPAPTPGASNPAQAAS